MKQIRSSKCSKFLAYYLAIMMFLQVTQPLQMYALTSGPTQPEFNAFTPIGTSDMVDLASGDFNYNIPIMDVGGYPINLAYNSGVTMDQEASWVGLGWNLNVGQIERQVRGIPDDFSGEAITYETNLKKNQTVGFTFRVNGQLAGFENAGSISGSAGLTLQHNNYTGISAKPSFGLSYEINENVSVGMNLTSSATEGVTVEPYLKTAPLVNLSAGLFNVGLSANLGLSYNSRQGLQSYTLLGGQGSTSIAGFRTGGSSTLKIDLLNNTFTPSIRNEYITKSGTFDASLGGHAWLFDGEGGVQGFFSAQKLKNNIVNEKAYGYENTNLAAEDNLLDFNRENDRSVSKNTRVLPVTNYTYDVYNMQTQGMSGSFRPYQSQVGYVFDANKKDVSKSGSLGVELEIGWGVHAGASVEYSQSDVSAGVWNSSVVNYFNPTSSEKLDYEKAYFKLSGDLTLDSEINILDSKLGDSRAMDIKLYNVNSLSNKFRLKNTSSNYDIQTFTDKIKRSKREKRNQVVYKVKSQEADNDAFITKNPNAKNYHTAGFKALNSDGSMYVFGETVYNKSKEEVTFAVDKNQSPNNSGIIIYDSITDASSANKNGIDHYYNSIITPEYANTYLLTHVLSSDYEDVTGNGPSDDDLGSYTKFDYKHYGDYKWRAPYYGASYNPGFNSDRNHKKASFTYGVKETKYISKIETKTHVAFFELSPRKDGLGVDARHNMSKNISTSIMMYKIDRIKLYSKPEAKKANLLDDDDSNNLPITPIKTAHFVYNYDLCKGVHNNFGDQLTDNEDSNNGGKLTLKKVYFTYRDSNMGKYTPYVFKYDEDNALANPTYDMKSFDVWGNYKKNTGTGAMLPSDGISSVEFPYVEQDKNKADLNTACWNLKTIQLPSGGEIQIETESDDYQFVQNKRALEMFKVIGVTKNSIEDQLPTNILFNGIDEAKRIIIEVDQDYSNNEAIFIDKYIGKQKDKPIFFRFMLNMAQGGNDYDYVEGYFKIDRNSLFTFFNKTVNGETKYFVGIPMQLTEMEGGINGNKKVNPISKAGWYFGRQNMNKTVYGLNNDPSSENVFDIVNAIGSSLQSMVEIFKGPNGRLRNDKRCAQKFIPEKSWIRLQNPTRKKLGGGSRVKSIRLSDKWTNMLSEDFSNMGSNLNSMEYGQEYDYTLEGASSGVATYEPLGTKDNPIIEPLYDEGERLIAPKETNYTEKPFGASFFPSPTVTYSNVTVKNLSRKDDVNLRQVKKHATGYVINEFYTSKDFPTITDFTEIKNGQNLENSNPNPSTNFLAGIIGLPIIDETKLTISQGFVVESNDMNGKQKGQKIYNESNSLISSVEYKYNIKGSQLNNKLPVIDNQGTVSESLIGINYDVINDFRKNISKTAIYGLKANVSIDIWSPFPPVITALGIGIPSYALHNNELRMATTTKVIHKKGILVEKIAYDLGSTVSTKNLAWDADSGQVLLTETVNEYDDHYYNFNYPAYWMYSGMGLASNNIGIEGKLVKSIPTNTSNINSGEASNDPYFKIIGENDLSKYFHLGDELFVGELSILPNNETSNPSQNILVNKLWVVGFNNNKSGILLMDRQGNYVNKCNNIDYIPFKIVRSGYRNLQAASMASVTSMINPIRDTDGDGKLDFDVNAFAYNDTSTFNPRIINASAVVYNDYWKLNGESNLPNYPEYDIASTENYILPDGNVKYPYMVANPYVLNIKGDWRAIESYAYLTGRNHGNTQINNPRNEGFYKDFSTFYKLDTTTKIWSVDKNKWTYASSVTKYSPYGVELENKDALNRHSAAQYGYNYTLPMAVASNSKYDQMGFEGFEETPNSFEEKHFSFNYNSLNEDVLNSHTGKKSIRVNNNSKVTLNKFYKKSNQSIPVVACPVDNIILCPIGQNENVPIGSKCFADTNEQIGICFEGKIVLNGFDLNTITIQNLDGTSSTPGYSYNYVNSLDLIIKYHSTSVDPYPVNILFTSNNGTCCSIILSYRHETTGTFGHFSGPIPCTN